jgi:hypothetical protein
MANKLATIVGSGLLAAGFLMIAAPCCADAAQSASRPRVLEEEALAAIMHEGGGAGVF